MVRAAVYEVAIDGCLMASLNREMGDADGPFVAAIVYEEIMRDETLDPDSIPYALDSAIRKLRQRRLPPHRWAPYIHVGA